MSTTRGCSVEHAAATCYIVYRGVNVEIVMFAASNYYCNNTQTCNS
jgi:hypothetical protein